ncbi:hypothetical protein WJX81_000207 [Elliptochloris bilobata]|uniref:Pumilio domain-containing protein NOP9 n=1 Tax=Elliptochloris bilobata TaxID=381761 RepID=A0AAW1RYH4_9CHLO
MADQELGAAASAASEPTSTRQRWQRLDEETVQYYTEVVQALSALQSEEDRALLAANALGEAEGRQLSIATDAACSRALEVLLSAAAPAAVAAFARALAEPENYWELVSSPFGSHVAERLLDALGRHAADGNAEASAEAGQVLASIAGSVRAHLGDHAAHRSASHAARRLLSVLAGRDVAPAAPAAAATDGAAYARATQAKQGRAGLSARFGVGAPVPPPPPQHPELLRGFADALGSAEWAGAATEALIYDPYGGPWLQALLTALARDREALQALIPRILAAGAAAATGEPADEQGGAAGAAAAGEHPTLDLAGLDNGRLLGLMRDRTSSHLMEVVVTVAPEELLDELQARYLRGELAALAAHPCGNFVVQALAGAAARPQPVRLLLRELRDAVPELLGSKRAGVVAALLAASERCGNAAVQTDAARALSSALAARASAGRPGAAQGWAAALLTLDTGADLSNADERTRLSTLGSAMLACLLRMPKEASAEFAEALAGLPAAALRRAGADSAGSRALEAFFGGAAPVKAKRRLLRRLLGGLGALSAEPGGSHVVQAAYASANLKDKEAIAGELAAAEAHIASTPRGLALLRRCNVEEFKRGADGWRAHARTSAALRDDIAALGSSEEQLKQGKRKKVQVGSQPEADGAPSGRGVGRGGALVGGGSVGEVMALLGFPGQEPGMEKGMEGMRKKAKKRRAE